MTKEEPKITIEGKHRLPIPRKEWYPIDLKDSPIIARMGGNNKSKKNHLLILGEQESQLTLEEKKKINLILEKEGIQL